MHIVAFKDWLYYKERAQPINEYIFTKIDARKANFVEKARVSPYGCSRTDRCQDCVAFDPNKTYDFNCSVVDIKAPGEGYCSYFLPRKAPFGFWEEKQAPG